MKRRGEGQVARVASRVEVVCVRFLLYRSLRELCVRSVCDGPGLFLVIIISYWLGLMVLHTRTVRASPFERAERKSTRESS